MLRRNLTGKYAIPISIINGTVMMAICISVSMKVATKKSAPMDVMGMAMAIHLRVSGLLNTPIPILDSLMTMQCRVKSCESEAPV
jgi:hypothetical protein